VTKKKGKKLKKRKMKKFHLGLLLFILTLSFIAFAVVTLTEDKLNLSSSSSRGSRERSADAYESFKNEWVKPVPIVHKRNDIGKLIQSEGFKSGIEVGVLAGLFARITLQDWPSCERYVLVDAWRHLENYQDSANTDSAHQEKRYEQSMTHLAPWIDKGVVEVCRDFSSECAKKFKDESVDYVYLDARHDYLGASDDLEAYWPLVRRGGILAGHDFLLAKDSTTGSDYSLNYDGTHHPGSVEGAVTEFAEKVGRQIQITYKDGHWKSWLIRK
jgi:Methyltransferase domain